MRIAYGVHGYSRGHASRALSVLTGLRAKHDVKIYAGNDAHELLSQHFDVEPIPSLGFHYRRTGQRSNFRSLLHNVPTIWDLIRVGPETRRVRDSLRAFRPDVIISDAEPFVHRAGSLLGVPRINFDHFGIMVYCDVPMPFTDRLKSILDRVVYRSLMGNPQHVLVSSFFAAPPLRDNVRVIPPLLRDEVHELEASNGAHLLAYFNQGRRQLTDEVLGALAGSGSEVRIYGSGRQGSEGRLHFLPPSNRPFLEDLASCRAVVSTAGNQLVGEALHFGKPLLVMPERLVEQRLNAAAIERMGLGEQTDFASLTAPRIRSFLERVPVYAEAARAHAKDGREEALALIDGWLATLPPPAARKALIEATA